MAASNPSMCTERRTEAGGAADAGAAVEHGTSGQRAARRRASGDKRRGGRLIRIPGMGRRDAILWLLAAALVGCATPYERGAALYREGDLRGALDAWRNVAPGQSEHAEAQKQIGMVEAEFGRMLQRYEKRGLFYESEGRLAEALLSYRLALKLDPEQPELLTRVQQLVRSLDERKRQESQALRQELAGGDLVDAGQHARELEKLDPFSPVIQVDVRQVRAELGEEVLKNLESGKASYNAGARARARVSFEKVLELDPENETALGYLSYIRNDETRKRDAPESGGIAEPPVELTPAEISAEGYFRSATQAEQAQDLFRALQQYNAALRERPSHVKARAALEQLRDRMRPQIPELEITAKRYFQDEDLQNAVLTWKRVLLIDPERQSASNNLERAERMLARLEELQSGGTGGS
jgi:tetratricopeptide (TPR) repeat protein